MTKLSDIAFYTITWKIVAISTTIISMIWDVSIDWGLGFNLREKLYFPRHWYYIAILLNLIFRLGWALNLSPGQDYVQQNIILILGKIHHMEINAVIVLQLYYTLY